MEMIIGSFSYPLLMNFHVVTFECANDVTSYDCCTRVVSMSLADE